MSDADFQIWGLGSDGISLRLYSVLLPDIIANPIRDHSQDHWYCLSSGEEILGSIGWRRIGTHVTLGKGALSSIQSCG